MFNTENKPNIMLLLQKVKLHTRFTVHEMNLP